MYPLMKLLHILAVTIFLGNIITGLFWKFHADRTMDPRILAHTMDGIIRSDRYFTIPGVIFIVASGVAAALRIGMPLLRTPWLLWSIVLFSLSGLVFVVEVAPLQKKLLALTRGAAGGELDQARYRAWSRRWEAWGLFAVLTPLLATVLMVLKPSGG